MGNKVIVQGCGDDGEVGKYGDLSEGRWRRMVMKESVEDEDR